MQFSKYLFLLFISFFMPMGVFSNIDSLQVLFDRQTGVEKIETGLLIAEQMADNPAGQLSFSLQLFDEAEKLFPKTMLHARAARGVADASFYNDSIPRSNQFLKRAIGYARKVVHPDSLFLGSAYNDLGLNYLDAKRHYEAKQCLFSAIGFFNPDIHLTGLADAKSNLAQVYYAEGNYDAAIKLLQEAYLLDLKTGDKKRQSSSLNSLGRMYVDWGKHETGLELYFQSISLLDTIADRRVLGVRYNNIGMLYQTLAAHTEAVHWFNEAVRKEEPYGMTPRMATRYYNLGNSLMAQMNSDHARENFEKAREIYHRFNLYPQLSKVYGSLGQLFLNSGLLADAQSCLIKAKEYAGKGETLPEKSDSYKHLYEYYKQTGNFRESLYYFEQHTQAEDSIFNLKVSAQVEEMEARYKNQQKQAEIERLEAENEIKAGEIAFKKRQRNMALAGAGLLLLLLASLLYLFITLRKQSKILKTSNRELDRLNKTLNRLFAILSHDMRNATASYQSLAKVIGYHLDKGQPEKLIPVASEISTNAQNLSSMLEGLLQWSALQMKGIEPGKEVIRVAGIVKKEVALLRPDLLKKDNVLKTHIGKDDTILCDPESFSLIIRNLIGNANKFTQRGLINIYSECRDKITYFTIRDTGCGMPSGQAEKIFSNNSGNIRTGTSGERGTGLGLMLVKEHVEKNGGSIAVESEEGKGTIFTVSFPSDDI